MSTAALEGDPTGPTESQPLQHRVFLYFLMEIHGTKKESTSWLLSGMAVTNQVCLLQSRFDCSKFLPCP